MSDDRAKRVRLEGGPQGTSSSVEIVEDGAFKVEFYDFSDEADRMMGGEVLHYIIVAPSEKLRLLELLDLDVDPNAQTDELLLGRMRVLSAAPDDEEPGMKIRINR